MTTGVHLFFLIVSLPVRGREMIQDLRKTFVIASAAKQSRHAATGKTGLPRLLRRLAMTMCVSLMICPAQQLPCLFIKNDS
jgi:hypothetical protein